MRAGVLILLLQLFSPNIRGSVQDCNAPKFAEVLERIENLNDTYTHSKAIRLVDSLVFEMEELQNANCPVYFKAKIEKGKALRRLTQYEEALKVLYAVVEEAELEKYYHLSARAYTFIALIHEVINRGEDCSYNLKRARELIVEYNLEEEYPWYCIRSSSYHRFYGQIDSAKYFAREAYSSGIRIGDKRSEMDGALLLGVLTSDVDSSILYFQKVVDLLLMKDNYMGASQQLLNVVSKSLGAGRVDDAATYLKKVKTYLDKATEKNREYFVIMAYYYNSMSALYKNLDRLDSALFYSNKAYEFSLSAGYQVDQKVVDQAETNFAIEIEKKRVAQLRKDSRRLRNTLFGGLGFSGLLLFFIYLLWKNRSRIKGQNELISLQNNQLKESNSKNEILLSEVHHRVKNNLQNIISLILLKETSTDNVNEKEMLKDISNRIRTISLIHEQLYSTGEFEKINVSDYFQELVHHFGYLLANIDDIEVDMNVNDIWLNLETVIPLGIIFSELVTNSIKYAKNDQVLKLSIQLSKDSDANFTFIFEDNGLGYTEEKLKYQGLGMRLIHSMVRQLHGQIEIDPSLGARNTIKFKEKNVSIV